MSKKFKVHIIESEPGWGQQIKEIKYFDTPLEAEKFVREFNFESNEDNTPDLYLHARFVGLVEK